MALKTKQNISNLSILVPQVSKNIQIKDLRTFFNWMLVHEFGFSNKDAGKYIGNSVEVNKMHYDPYEEEFIRAKTNEQSFTQLLKKSA